jgi:hypothetical protein
MPCLCPAAAVADLEAEAAQQAARDASLAPPGLPSAGHVPALMGPAVLMGAPIRPPGYQPPAGVSVNCSCFGRVESCARTLCWCCSCDMNFTCASFGRVWCVLWSTDALLATLLFRKPQACDSR